MLILKSLALRLLSLTNVSNILSLFIVLFVVSAIAVPPIAPPSKKMTFNQYTWALKNAVSQISDLRDLWNWTYRNKTSEIYLGGGALRGLVRWLHIQAQTHTYEQLIKLKPPSISELLIVKSSDKDLYTPDHLKKVILDWKTYSDWDVLAESFYKETVDSQGPTIDKVGVSPGYHDNIRDPFNALFDIYHGRIVLSFSSRKQTLLGDPQVGLVMRFLRFTIDLKDIAEPTIESMSLVKQVISAEAWSLPENIEEHPQWASDRNEINSTRVRIARNLSSLMKALKDDPIEFIKFLKKFELLEPLAEKHYGIFHIKFNNPALVLANYRSAGLSHLDMVLFAKMAAWDVTRARRFHEFLIETATTNEEIVRALAYFWKEPNIHYRTEIGGLLDDHGRKILARLDYRNLNHGQKAFFDWFLVGRFDLIKIFNSNQNTYRDHSIPINEIVSNNCQVFYKN